MSGEARQPRPGLTSSAQLEFEDLDVPGLGMLRFDPSCREEVHLMLHEMLVRDEYLRQGLRLGPGAIVFDVGANIGIFALHAQRRCAGRCSVFAFEPIRETFDLLSWNITRNRLPGTTFRLFDFGLTSLLGPRELEFTTYPGLSTNATAHPASKAAEFRAVQEGFLAATARDEPENLELRRSQLEARFRRIHACSRRICRVEALAKVLAEERVPRIDLLKLDAEGAEEDILAGLDEASWPLVRQIVVESNSVEKAHQLEALLRGRGFSWTRVDRPDWASSLGLTVSLVHGRRES